MKGKGKMSAAQKQRRRERRAARRKARVDGRTDADQLRRDIKAAVFAEFGSRALEQLRKRAEKVHRERMA